VDFRNPFHQAEVEEKILTEAMAGDDPIALFARWFDAARASGAPLAEAMTLATATPDGRPAARLVLLKDFGADGFVFYTNYESRKAAELNANPRAALVFHWTALERQVRIEGSVDRASREDAAEYFATRPRESQLGAWASMQSEKIASREELETRAAERAEEFAGRDVPVPPYWGGFRVDPDRIEFWQGRTGRLHDRLLYERTATGWTRSRLSP
jgi:pyridoxamine 5'-phosphate oxidase